MINKKYILVIDSILLFGILTSIFLLVGYTQPLAIAPLSDDFDFSESSVLFYFPKVDFVLIDDNTKFDSPETVFIGESFEIPAGRHFIKFFDGLKGEIRQIDTEENIVLEFKLIENRVGVFNKGQTALSVETYNKGSLVNHSVAYTGGRDE